MLGVITLGLVAFDDHDKMTIGSYSCVSTVFLSDYIIIGIQKRPEKKDFSI